MARGDRGGDGDGDGLAYLAATDGAPGPPVLVVHSWWGLTSSFIAYADLLAARGFLVGCADLYDGAVARSEEEVCRLRSRRSVPAYRRLRRDLEELCASDRPAHRPPAVVGFSMGGHWAVWLAQHPEPQVSAVVLYYSARGGDFSGATAPVLAHFAADDAYVSPASRRAMEWGIRGRGLPYAAYDYAGTRHWFAESAAATYHPRAAALALDRTAEFLARSGGRGGTPSRGAPSPRSG